MRKSLSLLLAIALVFSMFGSLAYAAEEMTAQEKFDALVEKGIFTGLPGEDPAGLDKDMTRAQFARIAGLLLGIDVDATPETSTFTDVPTSEWFYEEVEAAVANGLMEGNGDGTFDPNGEISVQELAIVLANILGLEEVEGAEVEGADSWAAGYIQAILDAGFELPTDYTGNAKRELLVISAYTADMVINPPVVPADIVKPEVSSVSVNDLKTVKVTFTEKVDKTTAETVANYTVKETAPTTATLTVASATLSEDGLSVSLNLKAAGVNDEFTANQAAGTVEVKNVKDVAGNVIDTVTKTLTAFDATVPTVTKVELTGPKKLTLTFSEPIETVGSVVLDNGTYFVTVPAIAAGGATTLDVTVGTTLPAGAHSIKVKDFVDYAGFKSVEATLNFDYVVDTTIPTVSVKSATETVVTLTFSKGVTATGINTDVTAYHTYNNVAAYKATLAMVSATEYTATFTTPIAQGTHTFYLNAGANKLEDGWGNDVATLTTLTVQVTTDTVLPTVTSVVSPSDKKIEVTFSEDVDQTLAQTKANYTFLDAAGAVITTHGGLDSAGRPDAGATLAYVSADKKLTITLDTALSGANYALTVKGVKDKGYVPNTMADATLTFTVSDSTAPTLTKALVNTARDQILVYFDEPMSTEGLTTTGNYYYILDGAATASLPANSSVSIVDTKTVKITLGTALAATFVAGGNDFVVVAGTLKDVTGNALGGLSKQIATTADAIVGANISNVKANSLTSISFEVDKELSSIDVNDFKVDNTAASVTGATYVNSAGKATVTLTVDNGVEDIKTDLSGIGSGNILNLAAGALTSTFNTASGAFDIALAAPTQDKIAPSLTTKATASTTTIALTYSEDIKATTVSLYTYTVAGNTVTNVGVAGSVVTLTLGTAIATSDTPSVTQALDIQDANGNALAASGAVTVADGVAPTVVTQLAAAGAIVSNATHTLVFSEALNSASQTAIKALIDAAYTDNGTGTSTSAWDVSGTTLTVTITAAANPNDVVLAAVANTAVTDASGNVSAALDLQQ